MADNTIPQGAVIGNGNGQITGGAHHDMQPQSASGSGGDIPGGATIGSAPEEQGQNQNAQPQPEGSFVNPYAQQGADLLKGIGSGAEKGLSETVHGIGSAIHKGIGLVSEKAADAIVPQAGLDAETIDEHPKLDSVLNQESTATKLGKIAGYGGENLVEFMMGDEALKGLSLADKYIAISKTMKVLEKSPKIMNAVKLGAYANKPAEFLAALSPEERAMVKANPYLKGLFSAGMDAMRQGLVQGTQTGVKTGDAGAALESGTTMAAMGTLLGAPGALLHGLSGKMAGVGEDISKLATEGNAAKSVQTVSGEAEDSVNKARQVASDITLGEANAAPEKSTIIDNIKNAVSDEKEKAFGPTFKEGIDAPHKSETAKFVNESVKEASQRLHTDFEAGQQDIVAKTGDSTIDAAGSPLANAAKDVLGYIKDKGASTHETVKAFDDMANEGLTDSLRKQLEKIAAGGEKSSTKGSAGFNSSKGSSSFKETNPYSANDLIELRKSLRKVYSNLEPGDINARAIQKMMYAVDDSIGSVGGDSVKNQYDKMKQAYREGLERTNSNLMKKAASDKTGGEVDDVTKAFLSGGNPKSKIDGLVSTIGRANTDKVADSIWKNALNDSGSDPDKMLKWWDKMPTEAKQSLFGKRFADLDSTMEGMRYHSSNFKGLDNISNVESMLSKDGSVNSVKQLRSVLGEEKSNAVAKDVFSNWHKEANGDPMAFVKQWNQVPDETKREFFGDLYHHYAFIEKDAEKQVARFSGIDKIDNVATKVQGEGKAALDFAKNIKETLGEEKTDKLAQDVVGTWVKKSTKGGVFDPKILLNEYGQVSDEVRREMFSGGNAKALEKLMQDAGNIQKMQRLAKIGITMGSGLAGAATGALGADFVGRKFGAAGGAFPALLGMLAGGGGGYAAGTALLDYVVQHPESWNKASRVVGSGANVGTGPVSTAIKSATSTAVGNSKKQQDDEVMKKVLSGANIMAGDRQ